MSRVMRTLGAAVFVAVFAASALARQGEPQEEEPGNDFGCHLDGRNPGSVLIFPVHRQGNGWLTAICVTNTASDPIAGSTKVHYEYFNAFRNPANPFCPTVTYVFNRVQTLTPNDTLCVITDCHNPQFQLQGIPTSQPGESHRQGYLVVSAQNPDLFQTPWSFNHLIGAEFVVSPSGAAFSLNAFSVCSPLPEGAPTDLDLDTQLDFDDAEYRAIPSTLYLDGFVGIANSNLAILNLTGGPDAVNTLQFSAFNDNEFPLSVTRTFCGWFHESLASISPLFTDPFLAGLPANATGEIDADCDGDGDFEGGWTIIESLGVSTPGGDLIAADGAFLGAVTAGPTAVVDGGRLLWESVERQANGAFFTP